MNAPGGYNREKIWEDLYINSQEPTTGEQDGERDFRTFAEMFEARGLKGFNPAEKTERRQGYAETGRRYPENPERSLDLHGNTIVESEKLLFSFIRDCRELGHKFVIVITGIGRNSEGGISKLRPVVVEKLNKMVKNQIVRDFKTADPRHGGFGALYVYLK